MFWLDVTKVQNTLGAGVNIFGKVNNLDVFWRRVYNLPKTSLVLADQRGTQGAQPGKNYNSLVSGKEVN